MKKKILGFIIGLLFIGVDGFAADGDLIVNGNIGIGTPNPSVPLYLYKVVSGTAQPQILIDNGQTGKGRITTFLGTMPRMDLSANMYYDGSNFYLDDTTYYGGRLTIAPTTAASGSLFRLGYITPGTNPRTYTDVMYVNYAGNVGIGNSNPSYLLTMETSGGGYYNQSTHGWVNGSSGRWKSNVTPITGALDTLLKLNGVSFKWKKRTDIYEDSPDGKNVYVSSSWADDPNGRSDIGLTGEDVMKVLPEVVDTDPKDPNFVTGVDYSKIVAVLIEAIKEQQKAIEDLRMELEKMKVQ
jgi:hypothetical protein